MYIPLSFRLAFFYTLLLGVALWLFGMTAYAQAEQRAYHDLDALLSNRAASIRLGKDIFINSTGTTAGDPVLLNGVNALGTDGVSIEVFDSQMNMLATTENPHTSGIQSAVVDLVPTRIPWDIAAIHQSLRSPSSNGMYSTTQYLDQHIRVYTVINNDFGQMHVIQVARSEQDIEQSLSDLRHLLLNESMLVLACTLVGGWFIGWIILAMVRRMTRTAQTISTSHDFHQRVPTHSFLGRDELAHLATTLNHMLSSLEEAYTLQQRFVADASHELRAPITSIRCNLDLLAKAPDLPPDEVQAALSDTRAEADRMSRLVSDLLLLAHADNVTTSSHSASDNGYKRYKDVQQTVDLDSVLLDVFRQYRTVDDTEHTQQAEKTHGPRLLLQHIEPATVYGASDQLKQVLVALLDNAVKYTPQEGSVTLSLTVDGQWAHVVVSDTGIGIFPEDMPHIFERFYRADRTRSRDRGGSGLGLAIVQSIVQQHQGRIEVESTPGQGSTFTLLLPLVR